MPRSLGYWRVPHGNENYPSARPHSSNSWSPETASSCEGIEQPLNRSICSASKMEVNMAKKKRGRPPGSKNKKSIGKSVATMDVSQLRAHIDSLQSVLAKKINDQ